MTSETPRPSERICSANFTDILNAAESTGRRFSARFPDERVELCTAATILEAPAEKPIGWSLRRFLQRRGSVVITDRRIFVQSSLWSPMTLIWFLLLIFAAQRLVSETTWTWAILATGAGIVLFQRRPYTLNIPFSDLTAIRYGSVQGVATRGDILVLSLGDWGVHLVTSKVVPDALKRRMEASVNAHDRSKEES
jgi:hypothetical protein